MFLKYYKGSIFLVWITPETHNLALLGAPLDPGGSVMAQEQLKMYMQVKTKTVTDADPYSAQEQSAPETNSMEAQTLSS